MLIFSCVLYVGTGFFFINSYKETLLVAKMYEPALNFLTLTASIQIIISFLSCLYLYRAYLLKIDRPLSKIETYLNRLTKKEIPDEKLKVEETFSNIKNTSLLIKILVAYWRMEHHRSDKKIHQLQGNKKSKKSKPLQKSA